MPLGKEALDRLRDRLLARRHALVRSARRGQRDLEALKEQGATAEMEEDAQSSSAQYVITQLSDTQRREVEQIDNALQRMEAGTYGICVDCGAEISEERLTAVPFAIRDAGCGSKAEERESRLREFPSL